MFVVILRYPDPEAITARRPDHEKWIYAHEALGHFLYTGPMVPRVGGVILADVPSRAELDAILREDPYAELGATYETHEFNAIGGCLSAEGKNRLQQAGTV